MQQVGQSPSGMPHYGMRAEYDRKSRGPPSGGIGSDPGFTAHVFRLFLAGQAHLHHVFIVLKKTLQLLPYGHHSSVQPLMPSLNLPDPLEIGSADLPHNIVSSWTSKSYHGTDISLYVRVSSFDLLLQFSCFRLTVDKR